MHDLAIVIPAYKPDFLERALRSLAAQTDTRFSVYVGDDAGPPGIAAICRDVDGIDLHYHRFDRNLGGRSLTAQWNRCIERSAEPWVWLLGDDDEVAPECVARFHDALPELDAETSVVRFNTDVIGADGRLLQRNPDHPSEESGADFVFARLEGRRSSYVVEYVFRRSAWARAGGFPDYPAAWCADDAAWFLFARPGSIRTLEGPRVSWRASGINITDSPLRLQEEKLAAGRRFLDFVRRDVEPAGAGVRPAEAWSRARGGWYERQLRYLSPLPPRLLADVVRDARTWERPAVSRALLATVWTLRAATRRAVRAVERRLPG